ncbi:hypothetical protein ES703_70355 [subsurface metagenome]
MTFQSQQYFLAGEPAQVNLALNPYLTVGVTLEELLVTGPRAECNAVAGRFRSCVVAYGVSKNQFEWRNIREFEQEFGEDGSAARFPRRVHLDGVLRRAARDAEN